MSRSTVAARFPKAQKLYLQLQNEVEALADEEQSNVDVSAVSYRMDELTRSVASLQADVSRHTRNTELKSRINGLAHKCALLRAAYDKHMRTASYNRQREDLLGNRSDATSRRSAVDHLLREQGSLERSTRQVDELADVSRDTLSRLRTQRDTLKGVRRKILDVGNLLGLSSSLLKLIERREGVDKWIVYGGMALTLCITFGLYHYVRS